MTPNDPRPASDEEIARVTAQAHAHGLGATWDRDTILPMAARISSDAATIKAKDAQIRRCHGIIQNLSAAMDPDHEAQDDAMKELRGDFCPTTCTSECDRKATDDADAIKAKDEEIERLKRELEHAGDDFEPVFSSLKKSIPVMGRVVATRVRPSIVIPDEPEDHELAQARQTIKELREALTQLGEAFGMMLTDKRPELRDFAKQALLTVRAALAASEPKGGE